MRSKPRRGGTRYSVSGTGYGYNAGHIPAADPDSVSWPVAVLPVPGTEYGIRSTQSQGQEAEAPRTLPIAVSIARALFSVSAHSLAGTESCTIPAPVCTDA